MIVHASDLLSAKYTAGSIIMHVEVTPIIWASQYHFNTKREDVLHPLSFLNARSSEQRFVTGIKRCTGEIAQAQIERLVNEGDIFHVYS